MGKDFNKFLDSVDYKSISEKTYNEFYSKHANEPAEIIFHEAIPEITIKLLNEYHNWLNS